MTTKTLKTSRHLHTFLAGLGALAIAACGAVENVDGPQTVDPATGPVSAELAGGSNDLLVLQLLIDAMLDLGLSCEDGTCSFELDGELEIGLDGEINLPAGISFCEHAIEIDRSIVCTDSSGAEGECNGETHKAVANYQWEHVVENCPWNRRVLASGHGTLTVDGLQAGTVTVDGTSDWSREASADFICDGSWSYGLAVDTDTYLVLSRDLGGIQSGAVVHTIAAERAHQGCFTSSTSTLEFSAYRTYERVDQQLSIEFGMDVNASVEWDIEAICGESV